MITPHDHEAHHGLHDEPPHDAHHDDATVGGPLEDWNDETFVGEWLARREEHAADRRRQFALIRAVIPKLPEQEFRYVNLGAGPGELDELLLDHFPGAVATLVDVSLMLLGTARERLARFGNRVEYVHANLAQRDWTGGVGDGFDFVLTTNFVHHLEATERIRALYAEVFSVVGHGGIVLNFDRVRTEDPALLALAGWAAHDPDAGLDAPHGGRQQALLPLSEHTVYLREAGFRSVDVLWKDLNRALMFGVRDHFHLPHAADGAAAPHAH